MSESTAWQILAQNRVDGSAKLTTHAPVIFYDWPEGQEHWKWVATATITEIVNWAEGIEQAERDQAEAA